MIPAHQLAAIRAAVNRGEGITHLSALRLLLEIDRLTFLWRNTADAGPRPRREAPEYGDLYAIGGDRFEDDDSTDDTNTC